MPFYEEKKLDYERRIVMLVMPLLSFIGSAVLVSIGGCGSIAIKEKIEKSKMKKS